TRFIKKRVPAFLTLCATGLVILLSFMTTTIITTAENWLAISLPEWMAPLFHGINLAMSWFTLSLAFCMVLKILPDRIIPWKRAWEGGMVAAILFMVGEYALGIYFTLAKPQSAYGVTGSLVLFLLWVSYSCLLLLFGAAFSRIRTEKKAPKLAQKGLGSAT
ncbi:MAG: YihY/virulence factor BrkB family protein, partial [Rickettsiales bacterium]